MKIVEGMIWILIASLPLIIAVFWQAMLPIGPVTEEVLCVIRENI